MTLTSASEPQLCHGIRAWSGVKTLEISGFGFPLFFGGGYTLYSGSNDSYHLRICDNYLYHPLGSAYAAKLSLCPRTLAFPRVLDHKAFCLGSSQVPSPLLGMGPTHLCSPSNLLGWLPSIPQGFSLKVFSLFFCAMQHAGS